MHRRGPGGICGMSECDFCDKPAIRKLHRTITFRDGEAGVISRLVCGDHLDHPWNVEPDDQVASVGDVEEVDVN